MQFRLGIAATFVLLGCSETAVEPEDRPDPPIHTPLWAFEPWISKDISSTDDTREFVRGFREREIPIGAVVLDSPWETNYNTFVPHPVRYHDFFELVGELHADNIRVVCWTTQMLNQQSFDVEPGGDQYPENQPLYRQAEERGYFINQGELYIWWKGKGGAIDFFNRDAVRWWHRLQDHVLSASAPIDGWKLDFGDSYVNTATISTAKGVVPHQEYSEAYYRDFWAYGVHVRGPEFLTMVRGYDASYHLEGRFYARPEHAPVVWMGDNRRDFVGLIDALDHLFRSSRAGYVVGGTDIGGYLDRDDRDLTQLVPFNFAAFARWTAVGALTPFMQLHGRANLAPWTVPERAEEMVELYRYWSVFHSELAPFFYSLAEDAYAGARGPIVEPIGEESEWPGDYRFTSGSVFLVAPILDDRAVREVELPAGARWFDWWAPAAEAIAGGTTLTASVAREVGRIPLFVKEGAIMPVRSAGARSVIGDPAAPAGRLGIAVWPAEEETQFRARVREAAEPFLVTAGRSAGEVKLSLERTPEPMFLRVRVERAPSSVTDGGVPVEAVRFDQPSQTAWIELAPKGGAREVILRF